MEEFLKLDPIDKRLMVYIAQFDNKNLVYAIEYHATLYKVRGISLDEKYLLRYLTEQQTEG